MFSVFFPLYSWPCINSHWLSVHSLYSDIPLLLECSLALYTPDSFCIKPVLSARRCYLTYSLYSCAPDQANTLAQCWDYRPVSSHFVLCRAGNWTQMAGHILPLLKTLFYLPLKSPLLAGNTREVGIVFTEGKGGVHPSLGGRGVLTGGTVAASFSEHSLCGQSSVISFNI